MSQFAGITRQDEEKRLESTITIAERKVESAKKQIKSLADELHELLDDFDESDKEMQAIWNNTDARFKEVKRELARAERIRKKPYFGRIDFVDEELREEETYYIGRAAIAKNPMKPEVIDWRAPIASVYYDHSLGKVTYSVKGEGQNRIDLKRKRTYEIEGDRLKDFYDSDVVANDDLLTKYLAKSKRNVLGEIIATIQQEQNEIIRKKPQHNLIVQGAAGSGKTTVAMHRISYILYNYELEFAPEDFYIIGSNRVLLQYITGVLPELDVDGVRQMTMEELFVRLLYEDWDLSYKVIPVEKGITPPQKGTLQWFQDLEDFCERYERSVLPMDDVVMEKNGVVLMTAERIETLYERYKHYSLPDKKDMLTEALMAGFENEISGKYYSYTPSEKTRLTAFYQNYFGKREWKGSIFKLYETFLDEQFLKGTKVPFEMGSFDVYDLAALAYLYKRIKEEEKIREAAHVVIDEAQDFGMMIYGCLKYCLSKCTYTIMGDISQNISMDYGLNDWKELQKLMLPGEFDTFELLRKSYRNTIEIAGYATDILYHGSLEVYPVEPIIRHGEEVETVACTDDLSGAAVVKETVQKWQENGMETIAIVCDEPSEAKRVTELLSDEIAVLPLDTEHMEFGPGVMVLTIEYTKGLEFDGVIIWNASKERYPKNDGAAKRLYVAATRALHLLKVLYQGELTPLIAEPVPEERKKQAVVMPKRPTRKPMPVQEEKTLDEIYTQQAREAGAEMERRNMYGPKRITVAPKPKKTTVGTRIKIKQNAMSVVERKVDKKEKATKPARTEFGTMPIDNSLRPEGHSRIDCSIRFVMASKKYVDFVSSYGTLRIIPMEDKRVRICFVKGQSDMFGKSITMAANESGSFKLRETKENVEIITKEMLIRVNRRSGAFAVCKSDGRVLLSEREREPRQIGHGKWYEYFAWDKKELLFAKDGDNVLEIGSAARYISHCEEPDEKKKADTQLASSKGYEITVEKGRRVMCCNVSVYGPFLLTEGSEVIDFIIKTTEGKK